MQSIPQGNKQQWTPPQGKYNLLKPLSSTQSPLGDSHPPKHPHMTDPTANTNDALVLRTQKEKPPHAAISSGPAASSADAHKNKKKRNSKSPPTNKMTNLTQPREPYPIDIQRNVQAMSTELQNNPMELTLPPLQSPDLLTPPATQNTRSPPWPQSEHGDTPPRITPTNFRNESPMLPPQSPSDYPRTVANTPRQPPLPELDPDITMTTPSPPRET